MTSSSSISLSSSSASSSSATNSAANTSPSIVTTTTSSSPLPRFYCFLHAPGPKARSLSEAVEQATSAAAAGALLSWSSSTSSVHFPPRLFSECPCCPRCCRLVVPIDPTADRVADELIRLQSANTPLLVVNPFQTMRDREMVFTTNLDDFQCN